jgi:uncharacterized paraquat-inducible protein A
LHKNQILLIELRLLVSISMVSCKDDKTKTEVTTEKQGKEYTSAYVCPMHCEGSGSAEEGKCGTCGMTLVNNEDHKANGHKH